MNAPTVLVRMADAGDLYVSWRWVDSEVRGIGRTPQDSVAEALRDLDAALPDPGAPGSLEKALTCGAFADRSTEYQLAKSLSRTFLHAELAEQISAHYRCGRRPHLRIQPAPRVARVPWELLALHPETRLIDMADISLLAPAAIAADPSRRADTWAQTRDLPVVAVLDPRIPGFRADSALGSVLGRMTTNAPLPRQISRYAAEGRLIPEITDPVEAFRRTDLDRDWLSTALCKGAARLLYVGHVTAAPPESGRSEYSELHLSCTADTLGFAAPTRTHRPFSAKDLLLGTYTLAAEPSAGPDIWPIPGRVALIACESGGDLRCTETLGLVGALLDAGARLITATRWPLPTDHAFHRVAGLAEDTVPLQNAVCAVDSAHEQDDPLVALADWQREQLNAWREKGAIAHSPLLWSAFASIAV
ncbi:CHAT domain-containing protein [Nocardia panacis]|uniref:CHAT domain-containing protein n=1 Tax=Nocardia panacis TaxID=2340916 RepID=A0A3A4K6X5_9NOCA|nr:CHAT domain-containing protein [Nocardia panacis]RJO76859.1 CHAT domain-containing protein [Nocardia panacis]